MAPPGRPADGAGPARRAARFLPPLALMAAIFAISHQPDLDSGLGWIDLVGRKVVHALEYGALWWLWLRAFGFARPALAAAIAVGYAATDEYHQTFVQGRHGSPVDVGIDAAGVAIAWTLWRGLRRRRSEPAALGGDEDGLRPVDRPELPVDVVEVGAHRAGRER
jgi:VanZ family protein